MSNKFFFRKIKIGLTVTAIIAGAGMYYYVSNEQKHFDNVIREIHTPVPVVAESLDVVSREPIVKDNKQDNFKPRYIIIYSSEENLSIQGAVRFAIKISVPLGLSQEELKQNLSHAAWRLLKQKNADAVIIWAYRDDDKLRAGGFTAGKCTLAPFGDWSKAASKHSLNDMQVVFDFADVYSQNATILNSGSIASIRKNTTMYKSKECDPEDAITTLKKEVKALVLEHYRIFTTYEFMDMYKVQTRYNKGKNYTGWVLGNDFISQQKTKTASSSTDFDGEWLLKNLNLHNKTMEDWYLASEESKIAICGAFLLLADRENLLTFALLNEESLKDYAKILANNVDAVTSQNKNFWYSQKVASTIASIALEIGWAKAK